MERLTERTADGILVKEDYGEDVLRTLYQCYGAEPMPHYANCDEGYCAMEKLSEYEDLEEQGKLLKLPCAVGDTVYRVHKGTKLSPERVYECKVVGVKQEYNTFSIKLHANINEETYSIWIDDWFDRCQIGHEFFLTEKEAEVALKEL